LEEWTQLTLEKKFLPIPISGHWLRVLSFQENLMRKTKTKLEKHLVNDLNNKRWTIQHQLAGGRRRDIKPPTPNQQPTELWEGTGIPTGHQSVKEKGGGKKGMAECSVCRTVISFREKEYMGGL